MQQEIVFASTGVKNLYDPPDKYVQAFAGEGIITSSPATNEAVYDSPKVYNRRIDDMPPPSVIEEVDRRIDIAQMESRHLAEGTKTIAESQFPLLTLVAQKRASVFARAAATAGRRFRSDQVRICEQICGKPSPKGELYVQAILTSRSSAATDSPSLLSTPVYQTYRLLQVAFVVAPIVAGLDKFFHLLVDWDQYLAPVVPRVLGGHGHQFMLAVGVIEIVAGFGVLLKPKIFVSVVAAWLLGIIVNLLLIPGYYDVAVRDLGLCVAALALGRLSTEYDH